ncbi:hypothetical protein Tco_1121370 [Tanacetum coccineum]|uniref:Uncharacterized protein n=1 Tax=Tanacetum coccineum TaxID=301880 RepID=A0ABQ5IZ17_9ASTR
MSVKYPNYVNLTSSSEEHPNERTPSPPPIKKSLSPPQASSKSISSKSTHYTSSSSPSTASDCGINACYIGQVSPVEVTGFDTSLGLRQLIWDSSPNADS